MSRMAELHAELTGMLDETRQMQSIANQMARRARIVADRHEAEVAESRAMQLHETTAITELLRRAA